MERTFCGLPLLTAPGLVMSPRVASEQLVAASLELIGEAPARVVDVGTGSGALAIAIASAAPRAQLWATDTSADAVAVARANVGRHGLAHRITVSHGDLLQPVPGAVDLIVANLPYLPAAEASRFPGPRRRAERRRVRRGRRPRAVPAAARRLPSTVERERCGRYPATPPGALGDTRRAAASPRRARGSPALGCTALGAATARSGRLTARRLISCVNLGAPTLARAFRGRRARSGSGTLL